MTAFQYTTKDGLAKVYVSVRRGKKQKFYCVNTAVGTNHHSLAYSNPKDALRVYYNVRRILSAPMSILTGGK